MYTVLEDSRLNHRVNVVEGVLADQSAKIMKDFLKLPVRKERIKLEILNHLSYDRYCRKALRQGSGYELCQVRKEAALSIINLVPLVHRISALSKFCWEHFWRKAVWKRRSLIALCLNSSYNYLDVSIENFKCMATIFGGFGHELSSIISGLATTKI